MGTSLPRLRQVALVARDLDAACAAVEGGLGLVDPFHDPGVEVFGLANAVYEVGDTFLEVVSPQREGTTAGRYLGRRGGDAGYMAIFQVADTAAARSRAGAMGLEIVWSADLDDISGTHLHPRDVPGAIVSFDTARPPESWRWGGPRWTGSAPTPTAEADRRGEPPGLCGLVVRLVEVESGARTWADLLEADLADDVLTLDGGRQQVRFEPATDRADEGISVVQLKGTPHTAAAPDPAGHTICGVRFVPA